MEEDDRPLKLSMNPVSDRINNRVKCGNYQLITFLVATTMLFCDGQEMLIMTVVNIRLKTLWKLSPASEGTLGMCVFAGVLVGSVVSGAMADKYGRKITIMSFLAILCVAGLGSALAPSLVWLVIIRAVAGIGLGGTLPASTTYIAELTPDNVRALVMLLLFGFGFPLGECLTALQSLWLDPNVGNNWRWLLALSSLPAFFSFVLVGLFFDETPQYLYANGRRQEAEEILLKMERSNKSPLCCCCCGIRSWSRSRRGEGEEAEEGTDGEEGTERTEDGTTDSDPLLPKSLMDEDTFNGSADQSSSDRSFSALLKELFNVARPIDTYMVWTIYIIVSLIFYGLVWIFPMTLKDGGGTEDNNGIAVKLLYSALAEVPSALFPILLIDWLGRKGTMVASFVLCIPLACACALLAPQLRGSAESVGFLWAVMGLKCMINGAFNVIYIYAVEYVPSRVRGFAVGMGSGASRIGGIATPYLMVVAHRTHLANPYWIFVGLSVVGLIATLVLKEVDRQMR